jgi:hypothetical protein
VAQRNPLSMAADDGRVGPAVPPSPGKEEPPMARSSHSLPWTHLAVIGAAFLALGTLPGCDNANKTTIINQGLDCGLVRNNLIATWQVSVTASTRTLLNCGNPAADNTSVDLTGGVVSYTPVTVQGADTAVTFVVTGDRIDAGNDTNVSPELLASVEADSCLAMFRVWDKANTLFVRCIGTLDRGLETINPAACDSVEIGDASGNVQYACDLSNTVSASVNIF